MAAERSPEFFAGKNLKIGIIGCGYVGLPLALRFADVGQYVTGFDLDKTKVEKLNAGKSYIQTRAIPPQSSSRLRFGYGTFPPSTSSPR